MNEKVITTFMNEKMGVISRAYQECDEFRISEITSNFLNKIKNNTSERIKIIEHILDKIVILKYEPKNNSNVLGKSYSDLGEITIFQKYIPENCLKFKYFIVHELIHVLQALYKKSYKDYTFGEKIRYELLYPYIDLFNKGEYNEITHFLVMLYYTTISESCAYTHQAYEMAFKYKMDNPNMSNHEIMRNVLYDLRMSKYDLDDAITNITSSQLCYNSILCILIGHFNELSSDFKQQFFSKEIFKLKSVKILRKVIYNWIKNSDNDIVKIVQDIKDVIIPRYYTYIINDFDIILKDFIDHLKYWFSKLQKKLGKAIQLGIDDTLEFA